MESFGAAASSRVSRFSPARRCLHTGKSRHQGGRTVLADRADKLVSRGVKESLGGASTTSWNRSIGLWREPPARLKQISIVPAYFTRYIRAVYTGDYGNHQGVLQWKFAGGANSPPISV